MLLRCIDAMGRVSVRHVHCSSGFSESFALIRPLVVTVRSIVEFVY